MVEGACHCGAVRWRFRDEPESATACNCTICRRYGALWAYGVADEDVAVEGPVTEYVRGRAAAYCFCSRCGCVTHYRALRTDDDGRRKVAVNLRMADPEQVADIPVERFDGLMSFDDLPVDGTCVKDLWF